MTDPSRMRCWIGKLMLQPLSLPVVIDSPASQSDGGSLPHGSGTRPNYPPTLVTLPGASAYSLREFRFAVDLTNYLNYLSD